MRFGGGVIVTFITLRLFTLFFANNMSNRWLTFCTVGLINAHGLASHLIMPNNGEPPFEYNISADAYPLCPPCELCHNCGMMNGCGQAIGSIVCRASQINHRGKVGQEQLAQVCVLDRRCEHVQVVMYSIKKSRLLLTGLKKQCFTKEHHWSQ